MTSTATEEIHAIQEEQLEIYRDLLNIKSLLASESIKLSQYNLVAQFPESKKVLHAVEKLHVYKKYHTQLLLLKSIIHNLTIAETLEAKDSLKLYKSLGKLDIHEFSEEIQDFYSKTTNNIIEKAQKVLEAQLKQAGWYHGPLLKLDCDILPILLEIK